MTRRRLLLSLVLAVVATAAVADFHVETTSNRFDVDSSGNVPVHVAVINDTQDRADSVQLTLSDGFGILGFLDAPGWSCVKAGAQQTKCTLASAMAAGASASVDFRIHFDQPYGRKFVQVSVQANLAGKDTRRFNTAYAVLYRRFIVTHTGDAGDGSLRAAIEALNADAICADFPCAIDFDIAAPEAVQRIAPASPRFAAREILIDGTTQTLFHGDTNPLGPEVEIDGA